MKERWLEFGIWSFESLQSNCTYFSVLTFHFVNDCLLLNLGGRLQFVVRESAVFAIERNHHDLLVEWYLGQQEPGFALEKQSKFGGSKRKF